MSKKTESKKKRIEIRITDVPESLYKLICKEAEKADRTICKEVLNTLKSTY